MFFQHIMTLIDVRSQYGKIAHYNITHRRRQNFFALPTAQWQMLAAPPFNLLSNLDRVDDAIDANSNLASMILKSGLESFGLEKEPKDPGMDWRGAATPSDMDKAWSTIRQMYRDWSADGAAERNACYGPVMKDIERASAEVDDKSTIKILIPGAGLGRLVFELTRRGYTVEGNEISYHQLVASNWVLNHTQKDKSYDLYPFALDFSNVISRDHQLKVTKIPDVHPGSVLDKGFEGPVSQAANRMSMTAADFVILYGEEEHASTFNAIITVFFIDTAPNLIRYIETIRNCLEEGGLWINLGPLLWHFAEIGPSYYGDGTKTDKWKSDKPGIEEPGSFELSEEEVLLLVEKLGFEVQEHELRSDGYGYVQNPESMLQKAYRTSHWTAKKKP